MTDHFDPTDPATPDRIARLRARIAEDERLLGKLTEVPPGMCGICGHPVDGPFKYHGANGPCPTKETP